MTQSKASYFILPTDDRDLERSSLSNGKASGKTTKKSNYGSLQTDATKTQQTANAFIVNYKHKLMPGDTLLNISLKYNVPIETIKRANRLWNNDLTKLFKDFLFIPLDKEKLKAMNLTMNGEAEQGESQIHKSESTIEMEKAEYKDFLSKFDSFINESKVKLATLESQNSNQAIVTYLNNIERYNQNSESNSNSFFREDDLFSRNDALFNHEKQASKKHQMESSSSSSTSSSNLSNVLQRSSNSNLAYNGQRSETPEHVTNKFSNYFGSNHNLISSTDGSSDRARKAKENLQRLEREKDDLYEL